LEKSQNSILTKSDGERHACQREAIERLMKGGKEWSLQQLAEIVHAPTQSIGARLRELRKPEHGSYIVISRRTGDPRHPVYLYRLASQKKYA
jgi:hypothetical protein